MDNLNFTKSNNILGLNLYESENVISVSSGKDSLATELVAKGIMYE